MKVLVALLLVLGLSASVCADNQTSSVTCSNTSTLLEPGQNGRHSLFIKVDSAATTCVTFGPTATDNNFQLCPGEGVVLTVNPVGDVWCTAVDDTESALVYVWDR